MDALEEILAPSIYEHGVCYVCQDLARIEDEAKRAQVEAAMANPQVKIPQLVAAFKYLLGHAPSDTTIKKHRSGHA